MITRRDAPYVKGKTALLLVDIQEIFCRPGLDPGHKSDDPDSYYFRRLRETAIPNQQRLLHASRDAGIPVIHTIIEALTKARAAL